VNLTLLIEQQALEERQIELASHPVRRLAVGRLAVPDPGQDLRQVALSLLEVACDLSQAAFGVGDFAGQPVLLALEQIQRHGIGVVSRQQLLAFAFELAQPTLLGAALPVGIRPKLG
jgi:hypothetical protein